MQKNNPVPEIEEVKPEGVDLYDFGDFDGLRSRIFDTVKDTITKKFPVDYGGYRIELNDVDYVDPERYSLSEQKSAIMRNKFLGRRLRGTVNMINSENNELVDKKTVTLMSVPYLTDRGTFIHNGNEYTTINQFRLEPGIYARRKESGEYEAHVNPSRGTGKSYRVRFEPDTAIYRFDFGQSSIRLYPVLKVLGISDETLREAWGDAIFEANKKDDKQTLDKLYNRFAKGRFIKEELSDEQKVEEVKKYFSSMKFSKDVLKKTLPNRVY